MSEKFVSLEKDDGLGFKCEICQDKGCQNCQGEYKYRDVLPKKDELEIDNSSEKDDGLSFICEVCQDQGCPQCGYGAKQERARK